MWFMEDRSTHEWLAQIVELLEAQNELISEGNLLKGEMLNALDELRARGLSVTSDAKTESSQPVAPVEKVPNPDIDYVDPDALAKAIDGLADAEVSVFWPKTKTRKGWARVSIKHPNLDSLTARTAKGCLCGKDIVIKKTDTGEFFTCEGVTKGGCDYRPAVYGDKMTFLTNLPPRKA
jgi:hypothetical protein